MIITMLDTETTGLEWGDHRIIEVYVEHFDVSDRITASHKLWRIHPERSIQPAAQAVHKISLMDLAGQPNWDKVAKEIRDYIEIGDLLVAHNGDSFDFPFLNYEFERVGLPKLTKPTFDTMIHGRWATPTGKLPNLGELSWACDVPYDPDKAHAADYDVGVMTQCFFRGVDWGFYDPPIAVAPALSAAA